MGRLLGLFGLAVLAAMPAALAWWGWQPSLVFGANLLGFCLILSGLGFAKTGNVMGFALSGRNTYSFSRLQIACWTVLITATLATIIEVNLLILNAGAAAFDVAVPGTVFVVIGIAGFSSAAAPAILSLKSSQATTNAAVDQAKDRAASLSNIPSANVRFVGRMQTLDVPASARLIDMLSGDEVGNAGTIDISKVQQLLITGLLLVVYGGLVLLELNAATARMPALPGFNERLAELLAISHATYLGYKATPKPAGNP